jgi:UDP-N-acetylmuramoylalanine--D-glutamate ligase
LDYKETGVNKMEFQEKNVLVFGSGKSGIAAAELLEKQNANIFVFEGNEKQSVAEIKEKSESFAKAEIYVGTLPEEVMDKLDFVVLSPGVPTDLPLVNAMRDKKITIIGEIELAYQVAKGKILAITGTNGKTTTTTLVGEILSNYFKDVKVVGNIGIPYTSVAADTAEETVTAAEISSFQLETIVDFAPDVSAILNITPDHLNRHHTMENYIKAKEDITKNQEANDVCVLNYEDEVLRKFGESLSMKVLWFDSKKPVQNGCYLNGEKIIYVSEGKEEEVIDVNELNILGTHNYENVMAAVAMTISIGVPMDVIVKTLREFQAVEHRIEYVTEKRGVKFYNDSKGTNPDAAIKGIQAMNRPTLLIGGGYDKQSEYDEWIESFDGKVKKLVLIGVTKEKIADCAKRHGFTEYVFADSLEEAVNICYDNAVSGDAVLLSPACASWDMFKSYEERGRIFKDLVRNLKE